MKNYYIRISQEYQNKRVEEYAEIATSISTAVSRAIKKYQKQYKGYHLKHLIISAKRI